VDLIKNEKSVVKFHLVRYTTMGGKAERAKMYSVNAHCMPQLMDIRYKFCIWKFHGKQII
jgi:hypothetical protein